MSARTPIESSEQLDARSEKARIRRRRPGRERPARIHNGGLYGNDEESRATLDPMGSGMAMEMLSRATGSDPEDDDDLRGGDLDDGMVIRRGPTDAE